MFVFRICDSWPQRRARNIWKPYQWKWITPPGRDLTERRDKQKLGFLKTVQLRTRDFLNIAQCTEEMNGEYSAQLASKLIYCEKKKHLDTKPKWKNGYTIWYDPQAVPKKRKVVKLHNFEWPFKASKRPPHCGEGRGMFHKQWVLWSKSTEYDRFVKD